MVWIDCNIFCIMWTVYVLILKEIPHFSLAPKIWYAIFSYYCYLAVLAVFFWLGFLYWLEFACIFSSLALVLEDLNLESGVTIPAGAVLVVPVQLVQKDDSSWGSDAGEFNPYRFLSKTGKRSNLVQNTSFSGWLNRNI